MATQQAMTDLDLAAQIFDYMEFRARQEGQVHELPVAYYQQLLDNGFRSFFGIEVGPGGLLKADTQQPELFEEWKRNGKEDDHA
jgi:hypothetical protein